MARVLLMTPSVYDFALFDQFAKPFALMRLYSWFEAAGWQVEYLNALDVHDARSTELLGAPKRDNYGQGHFYRQVLAPGESFVDLPKEIFTAGRRFARYGIVLESLRERMRNAFGGEEPDLVLITSGMTYWYKGVQEAVALAREAYPHALVVVGGIYATLMKEHCLKKCRPDGVFTQHSAAQMNEFLGELRPEWKGSLLPISGEIPLLPNLLKEAWGTSCVVRLNRGCFMNCDYCVSKILSNGFEQGAPEAWFQWLQHQYYENGIRHVAFYDDALLGKFNCVLKPFLEKVIASEMQIHFYCPNAMHIRLITEENARLMKEAGFVEIRLGYESDAESFHEEHDQKYHVGDFEKALKILHEAGFPPKSIRCYILAGLPHQRKEEVEKAIYSAARYGAQPVLAEFTPVPGSGFWKECIELSPFDIENEPLFQNNTFFPMEWEGFTKKDMGQLKNLARNILNQKK